MHKLISTSLQKYGNHSLIRETVVPPTPRHLHDDSTVASRYHVVLQEVLLAVVNVLLGIPDIKYTLQPLAFS
jgi:hypothetical protein